MTIREIAKIAGVSPATVSNVINNKDNVSEETRDKIKQILEEHHYKVKPKRRIEENNSIVFLKYRTHGMAVEENQGFISSIIDHIEILCSEHFYDLQIINANPGTINTVIQEINQSNAAGVIFLGTEYRSGEDKFIEDIDIPLVVLDNSMSHDDCDSVLMDNRKIAFKTVSYLKNMGHRRIGYINSNIVIDNLTERYVGYLEKMNDLGLERIEPIEVTPTLMVAYEELTKMVADVDWGKYDALVCAFDSLAIAAIRALTEHGIKVPGDISIIGVDDIPYSSMVVPPLTTIKVSRSALAYYVVDQLLKRIDGLESPYTSLKIAGELIERESVR